MKEVPATEIHDLKIAFFKFPLRYDSDSQSWEQKMAFFPLELFQVGFEIAESLTAGFLITLDPCHFISYRKQKWNQIICPTLILVSEEVEHLKRLLQAGEGSTWSPLLLVQLALQISW